MVPGCVHKSRNVKEDRHASFSASYEGAESQEGGEDGQTEDKDTNGRRIYCCKELKVTETRAGTLNANRKSFQSKSKTDYPDVERCRPSLLQ